MKRLILLFFFIASILSAQVIKEAWRLDNTTATNLSPIKQWDILPFGNQLGNLGATGTRWNFLYADTTITNHLSNTTWTLNSVGVTTTGTQINYLNGATGTTGTTTTNLVFSTSPVLVTPTLGVASGTSLALGGATLGSNVFSARGTWQFGTGTGSSATDSSIVWSSNSGSPLQTFYGTDGDAFSIGINTSDEALFTGASGGYSFDGAITSTSNTSTWDSLTVRKEASTLADSLGVITLATGVAGWGEVMAGDNQEWAHFRFTSAGVVTLINNSANVGTTENDVDKLNIYDAGAGVVIQNNLGASIKVAININYFVP